ncbi:hypothetical protein D9613_005679 [Agrocybe pediades]|uniref:Uncharacterized protein n=1 Tax=Agrocybe pediades TaxID=84607 RepID=A0A8H4VRR3_9AGAR|nr:hypothetical protein D9613_005679 [Agrocybe pediades]
MALFSGLEAVWTPTVIEEALVWPSVLVNRLKRGTDVADNLSSMRLELAKWLFKDLRCGTTPRAEACKREAFFAAHHDEEITARASGTIPLSEL